MNKKSIIFLCAVLLLIGMGVTGFFYYSSQKESRQVQQLTSQAWELLSTGKFSIKGSVLIKQANISFDTLVSDDKSITQAEVGFSPLPGVKANLTALQNEKKIYLKLEELEGITKDEGTPLETAVRDNVTRLAKQYQGVWIEIPAPSNSESDCIGALTKLSTVEAQMSDAYKKYQPLNLTGKSTKQVDGVAVTEYSLAFNGAAGDFVNELTGQQNVQCDFSQITITLAADQANTLQYIRVALPQGEFVVRAATKLFEQVEMPRKTITSDALKTQLDNLFL